MNLGGVIEYGRPVIFLRVGEKWGIGKGSGDLLALKQHCRYIIIPHHRILEYRRKLCTLEVAI